MNVLPVPTPEETYECDMIFHFYRKSNFFLDEAQKVLLLILRVHSFTGISKIKYYIWDHVKSYVAKTTI